MKSFFSFFLFSLSIIVKGQLINKGGMYIGSNSIVSVFDDIILDEKSQLLNDGELFIFKNFFNNGVLNFSHEKTTSYAGFFGNTKQVIDGVGESSFFFVEFNNGLDNLVFDLNKEIKIYGTSFFENGIIHENEIGLFTFYDYGIYTGLEDNCYVNNRVKKIGAESFTFPIGDFFEGEFVKRPISIERSSGVNAEFEVAFYWKNTNVLFDYNKKEESIGLIDTNEFWNIKSDLNNEFVDITINWSNVTTPPYITNNVNDIIIVRWNGSKWINEGGVVNQSTQSISTTTNVFGDFTLANRLSKESELPVIDFSKSNSFSPNGDGINDEFIIPGLEDVYPNFILKIYNRYGNVVYELFNNSNTNPNWWDGKSKGRLTLTDSDEIVPAATYWFVVDFNDGFTKPYQGWLYLNK